MNKLILFSLLGLLLMPLGYSALTDNVVAYYSMNETSGTIASDSTGKYYGIINGATVNTVGKLSKAYNFTADSQNVNISKNISLAFGIDTATAVSFNFWMKPSVFGASDSIIWNRGTVSDNSGIQFTGTGSTLRFQTSGSGYLDCANMSLVLNEWQMITLVFNNTANYVKMYKNGTLICQNTNYTYNWKADSNFNVPYIIGQDTGGADRTYQGQLDEFGIWINKTLFQSDIDALYNLGAGDNPFAPTGNISNYNVSTITDNTTWLSGSNSNWTVEFNASNNILIRTYNSTGSEVTQNIILTSPQISTYATGVNITSGTNTSINCNNVSVSVCVLNFTNPFNSSVWKTITFNINDVKNITYANTSKFFAVNSTKSLNFTTYLNDNTLTCNDYYNLTIPLAGITNQLIKSCELTSVWFNNSATYNYTAYLTNIRFGRIINNTYNYYTTTYNLSIPTYNSTIANNTYTDINWYLTTNTGYATSGQNINVSINFNGTTTYPTATGLNYSYIELKRTNKIIENVIFTLFLNISYAGEYVNFTQPYTLTIVTAQIDDCSVYTNQIMNITIKRETDRTTLIPFSNLIFGLEIGTTLFSTTINNDTNGIIGICINNSVPFYANASFSFDTIEFATENATLNKLNYGDVIKKNREHFYFNYYFNGTTTQNLFKLLRPDSAKIIFNLVDSAQQPLKNYYLVIKRWYAGYGYETIAMAKTGITGEAITYIKYNEPYYAFDVLDSNGVKVFETDKIVLTTTPTTIIVGTNSQDSYWTANGTLGYTNTWNNATGYFTSTMFSANGVDVAQFSLFMYYLNGSLICDEYSGSTTSYTVPCFAGNWNTSAFIVKGEAITNKGNHVLLFNYIIDEVVHAASVFSTDEGLLWLGIIMIVMSMAFVGISPSFLPLSPALSLILTNVIGLTSIGWMIVGGLALAGMVFMLWFMRN